MRPEQLRERVLQSPGSAVLLAHRAALSASKHGKSLDSHILNFCRQTQKLEQALETGEGVSLREIANIVADEKAEFWQALARGASKEQERIESLNRFVQNLIALAESIVPGVYFDALEVGEVAA